MLDKYGYKYRYTITNFYLRDILKNHNLKCSIIMGDELLDKYYLNKDNLIINLQTGNEKGSHWILGNKKFKIYFDSYGAVPLKESPHNFL